MHENNDIYTLRFYGNDVTPESFSIKELGQLLISFEEALQAIVDTATTEPTTVAVSVVDVVNQSNSILFAAQNDASKSAIDQYGQLVAEGKYTNLPEDAYAFHKKLVGTLHEKDCDVSLVSTRGTLFVVKNDEKIVKQESVIVRTKTVLYCHLLSLSTSSSESAKARARIELFTGEKISFEVSLAELDLLRPYLTNVVGLSGTAVYNTLTKNYIRFRLDNIVPYRKGNLLDGLERLKSISSGFWDNFGSDDEINNYLKH